MGCAKPRRPQKQPQARTRTRTHCGGVLDDELAVAIKRDSLELVLGLCWLLCVEDPNIRHQLSEALQIEF